MYTVYEEIIIGRHRTHAQTPFYFRVHIQSTAGPSYTLRSFVFSRVRFFGFLFYFIFFFCRTYYTVVIASVIIVLCICRAPSPTVAAAATGIRLSVQIVDPSDDRPATEKGFSVAVAQRRQVSIRRRCRRRRWCTQNSYILYGARPVHKRNERW